MIFRVPLLVVAVIALAASLAIDRPENLGILSLCGLVTVVLAAGAAAADAVPLRRIPFACSVASIALGFAFFTRAEVHVVLSAALIVIHTVGLVCGRSRLQFRSDAGAR